MTNETWEIDTAHSAITFSVRHMVIAKVRGRFATWTGRVMFDPEALTRSSVEVEIDAASIDTGVGERDRHLRSPDFFDVERFPKLRFRSVGVEKVEGSRYRLHGELTLRDARRHIMLDVEYTGQAIDLEGRRRFAFTATASVDRRDYGLSWNQLLEAGAVLVGDRVDIEVEVQVVQSARSLAA